MMRIVPMLALLAASPATRASAAASSEPIARGSYAKDLDEAVDGELARLGPTAGKVRSRHTVWKQGGATMTFLIEDNGSELLTVETWATAPDRVYDYPAAWRAYPVGAIQVGLALEDARNELEEHGVCTLESAADGAAQMECHSVSASHYLGADAGGTVHSVELRRVEDDWEKAVSRRRWLDVLGTPALDTEHTRWTFTTHAGQLVRSGDFLEKVWTVELRIP